MTCGKICNIADQNNILGNNDIISHFITYICLVFGESGRLIHLYLLFRHGEGPKNILAFLNSGVRLIQSILINGSVGYLG